MPNEIVKQFKAAALQKPWAETTTERQRFGPWQSQGFDHLQIGNVLEIISNMLDRPSGV